MSAEYLIADVAKRTRFTAATLRYYEEIGLLPAPGRTTGGYCVYDDKTLARLAFIARAKQLGCMLEEIAELLAARDGERCGPVQDGLRERVGSQDRSRPPAHRRADRVHRPAAAGRRGAARAHSGRALRRPLRLHLRARTGALPGPADLCIHRRQRRAARCVHARRRAGRSTHHRLAGPARTGPRAAASKHGVRLEFAEDTPPGVVADLPPPSTIVASSSSRSPSTPAASRWKPARPRPANRFSPSCSGRRRMAGRRLRNLAITGAVGLACAACCAGPVLAILAAIAAAGLASSTVTGVVGMAIAAVALLALVAVLIGRRLRRRAEPAAARPVLPLVSSSGRSRTE
jgi:DNA-binding transcriptional MerR regulator